MLELLEIIADGHRSGEQLFERLLRMVELHRDSARFEVYVGGQGRERLVDDADESFNRRLRLLDLFLAETREYGGPSLSALDPHRLPRRWRPAVSG